MFESKKKIQLWADCGDDFYYGRDGEKVDYEMAVDFYEKAMKKKHPHATYMMGLCYELGRYVDKDPEYAQILYEDAANYGDPDAQKRLKSGNVFEPPPPTDEEDDNDSNDDGNSEEENDRCPHCTENDGKRSQRTEEDDKRPQRADGEDDRRPRHAETPQTGKRF